ncbi:hypothetical protein SAMN04488034_1149 [Salinimicrobium catena]|uniref:DUF4377 domain-containing protein n=1 Tax=Salinimicrobium catena TaxID=390640 RepID=A0A1H5PEN8_9FLAO|nr:hypothetical protein [Salinimicrobium catena]SDL82194.1 hypothetical protein SAMN04488140_1149 [Salinimicrobium catena]SEF12359.1 hypothetical protein SAMN04488034_1149 [Salinimicrobium catena]
MKLVLNLFATLALIIFTATCNNATENTQTNIENMEVTGTIQQQGITSYQYGTHTLTNDETFYALRSEAVNLDNFLDQEVTIIAKKIEGYPLEGGPEYLLVLEVVNQ